MSASKMKLSTRLGLGFGTVLLLIVVSALGIFKLNTVKDGIDLIVDYRLPNVHAATEIIDANYQLALLARDPAEQRHATDQEEYGADSGAARADQEEHGAARVQPDHR